jgi:hypothetical protein
MLSFCVLWTKAVIHQKCRRINSYILHVSIQFLLHDVPKKDLSFQSGTRANN